MIEELLKYVLPLEIVEYFDLVEIKKSGEELHLHLDEKAVPPPEYSHLELSGNGFYASSTIKDFPLRDKKVLLHVRRRRWIDSSGKSLFPGLGFGSSRDTLFKGTGVFFKREAWIHSRYRLKRLRPIIT